MTTYLINGFCVKHSKHWLQCDVCREAHQAQESKRWLNNQRLNAQAVRRYNTATAPLYTATCGNPIEAESFH